MVCAPAEQGNASSSVTTTTARGVRMSAKMPEGGALKRAEPRGLAAGRRSRRGVAGALRSGGRARARVAGDVGGARREVGDPAGLAVRRRRAYGALERGDD